MKIRQFIPPIIETLFSKLTAGKKEYTIGKYTITLPPHFALPDLQETCKLYDRFLPVLAKHLDSEKTIVDIGANIGDTVIALLQSCNNPIVCIEASDIYAAYLEKNLNRVSPSDHSRVKVIKRLVGTGNLSGTLDHIGHSTAGVNIIKGAASSTHTPLDSIVTETAAVCLLKVDTDGFDFDVIKSAGKILADSAPVLFWENYMTEDFQYEGFNELYVLLKHAGYNYFYIFDNFGNLITAEADIKTLKDLNAYLYSMDKHHCNRTFHYTDILACTEKYRIPVGAAIEEYKKAWINK